ncbi:MAG: 2-oxoglutarate dehydrogenase complex dihydrolipoyllysine-residue succinyltransferase [Bdellovibrionota bacterium]
MKIEVKVPAVGESITEAVIGSWNKKSGDYVKRNDVLLQLETDKASVEVVAENDGLLTTTANAGDTVKIGSTIGSIDTDAKPAAGATSAAGSKPVQGDVNSVGAAPSPGSNAPTPSALTAVGGSAQSTNQTLSPAVQRIVTETGINPGQVQGTGKDGRLTKGDVLNAAESQPRTSTATAPGPAAAPAAKAKETPAAPTWKPTNSKQGDKNLVPMTTIRKRIAERLVEAQSTAALLTTFNEIDMTKLFELRTKYKDKFKEKYGVNLGFMGIFAKAAVEALKMYPNANAYIVGTNIEYHNYYNLGIAVSTEKGLMVPVIKDIDQMSVAQIEMSIRDYALKARDGKISIDDLQGGTFSITNGGTFGSLLSTPILNPPQSAILGMHKVEDRPVVADLGKGKEIVIKPMMYVALTYDHRMIDGKEAVGFLVRIKEGVEDPERLLLEI